MEAIFMLTVFLLIFGGFILNVITSIWCYRNLITTEF